MSRNEKAWKSWFDKDAPEAAEIPDGYHNSLDTFRRLLLIRLELILTVCETKNMLGIEKAIIVNEQYSFWKFSYSDKTFKMTMSRSV